MLGWEGGAVVQPHVNIIMVNDLKMKEVSLGVIPENKPAMHVYQKCGFKIYKTESKSLDHDGVLYDNVYLKKINPNT